MKFGLFGSAQARRSRPRHRQQSGLPRFHRQQCRSRGARLLQHVSSRAPLHWLWPGVGEPRPADLARRPHAAFAPRHGGAGIALAQPGAVSRAGGDPRSVVRRQARFRDRQRLSPQRIRRVLYPFGGGRARFEEALEVITKAFTSETPFSHRGRYWQFDDIVVEPPTAQKPHPPLWMGAGSANSVSEVVRRGYNMLLGQHSLAEETLDQVRNSATRSRR